MRLAATLLLIAGGALDGCGGVAVTQVAETNKALNGPPVAELMQPRPAWRTGARQSERAGDGDRICLAHLPPLRELPARRVSAGEEGVYRHRQDPLHRQGVSRSAAPPAPRPSPPAARRRTNISRCSARCLLRQTEWVSQEVRPDAIYSVAKSVGLSRADFDKCLANQTIIDGLDEVKQRGRKFGVVGTPTFFANGRKAQGAITFEEFKALLDPQSSDLTLRCRRI